MTDLPDPTETVNIEEIDKERARILKRVLFAVFRSDAGQSIIAQALDGLPIEETYELETTKRYDLLIRLEPRQVSIERARDFPTYTDMFDNIDLNARVCFPPGWS
jgi:hypothetical protein